MPMPSVHCLAKHSSSKRIQQNEPMPGLSEECQQLSLDELQNHCVASCFLRTITGSDTHTGGSLQAVFGRNPVEPAVFSLAATRAIGHAAVRWRAGQQSSTEASAHSSQLANKS